MKCLINPFKNNKFKSVDEAINVIKEYINSETSHDIELIYFTPYADDKKLFLLKFLLIDFVNQNKKLIIILDEITEDEANESWINIYK